MKSSWRICTYAWFHQLARFMLGLKASGDFKMMLGLKSLCDSCLDWKLVEIFHVCLD